MLKSLYFLTAVLLTSQFASAELKQLKLLNPDGTPAIDAQAVAIMTLGARVDENLKELPSLIAVLSEPGIWAAENESGTITFDSNAKAIVAQNNLGFVFVPAGSKATSAKLRPWAKLKIDTSGSTENTLKGQHFSVVWTNCFAGNAPRPQRFYDDPFEEGIKSVDWRFDQIVMWSQTYDDASKTIKIPPGEVTVVFSGDGFQASSSDKPIPSVVFNSLRAVSTERTLFKLPKFGSVSGKVAPQSELPDWNSGRGDVRRIIAIPFNEAAAPAEVQQAYIKYELDRLARFYASEKGTQFRNVGLPMVTSARVGEDGFLFEYIPEGSYKLETFQSPGSPNALKFKADSENKPLQFTVTAGKTTTLDEVEAMEHRTAEESIAKANSTTKGGTEYVDDPFGGPGPAATVDPFGGPADTIPLATSNEKRPLENTKAVIDATVKKAELKIEQALIKVVDGIEYQGTALRQVMQELEDACNVPIRLNTIELSRVNVDADVPITISLPSMTLRSALRNILSSVPQYLTFTIRDEVLLITTENDAAKDESEWLNPQSVAESKSDSEPNPQLDSGKKFIEHWLKSSKSESDTKELRTALQVHLEKEFDANQKSRQAELERLRVLLKQSEDWINTRQTRRDEIVRKRVEELLEQSKLAPVTR